MNITNLSCASRWHANLLYKQGSMLTCNANILNRALGYTFNS